MNMAEPLALEAAQSALELPMLVADDVRAEIAVGAAAIAILAESLWQVEDNCDRQEVMGARELDERLTRLGLHIRRVDDSQSATPHPYGRDVVKQLERVVRRVLRVFVIGHQAA